MPAGSWTSADERHVSGRAPWRRQPAFPRRAGIASDSSPARPRRRLHSGRRRLQWRRLARRTLTRAGRPCRMTGAGRTGRRRRVRRGLDRAERRSRQSTHHGQVRQRRRRAPLAVPTNPPDRETRGNDHRRRRHGRDTPRERPTSADGSGRRSEPLHRGASGESPTGSRRGCRDPLRDRSGLDPRRGSPRGGGDGREGAEGTGRGRHGPS